MTSAARWPEDAFSRGSPPDWMVEWPSSYPAVDPHLKSNIEIAQAANMKRITEIAKNRLGIEEENLEPYGRYKAKLALSYIDTLKNRPDGKLVLVTAISPTPAGEGKTT